MRQNESGNVFWYIFICIALLGALSFAIAQGGRTSVSELTHDTRSLTASEIIGYGDTLAKAVTQLRLRGTAVNGLSFANTVFPAADYGTYNTTAASEIFNPSGAAAIYAPPPPEAQSAPADYQILSGNEIENIGTTCGTAACADLILAAPNLLQSVCIRINELLGVDNPGGVPPVDSDIDETATFKAGASPFSYAATIGDEDSALASQREACFQETGESEYVYYKVLLPR